MKLRLSLNREFLENAQHPIMRAMMTLLLSMIALSIPNITNFTLIAENAQQPNIELDPIKIDILVPMKDMTDVPNAILYITARQTDLIKVSLNSTDLFEEQNRKLWISEKSISFSKNQFTITEGQTASVSIIFSFKGKLNPGSYKGNIIIWSENGGKAELPINIKLRLIWWIPFIFVAGGVVANLILSINRWRLDEQRSAESDITLADSEIYRAEDENRKDDRYTRAVNLKTQYNEDFNAGEYKTAREKAIRAKFEAEKAKTDVAVTSGAVFINVLSKAGPIYEQTAPKITDNDIINEARSLKPDLFLDPYKQPKPSVYNRYLKQPIKRAGFMYLTLTIIIVIVMLQAWQAFFPRISDFGASSIDFITAFIYGFSGQAFLSEFADIGKRGLV